jgi:hypothetical protein
MSAFADNSAYNMMKKMHSFDINVDEDGNKLYLNLLKTQDVNGQFEPFNISKAFPNL